MSARKPTPNHATRKAPKIETVEIVPDHRDIVRDLVRLQRTCERSAGCDDDPKWQAAMARVASILAATTHGLHVTRRESVLRDLASAAKDIDGSRDLANTPIGGMGPADLVRARYVHLGYDLAEHGSRGKLAAALRSVAARGFERSSGERVKAVRETLLAWYQLAEAAPDIDENALVAKAVGWKKKADSADDFATALVRAIFSAARLADPFVAEKVRAHRSKQQNVTSRSK